MFDSYSETSLRYYPDRCINCKRCTQVCPHAVFAEGPEHAELANPRDCMECGACALNCPVQAIEVQSGVGCAWAMIGAALRGKNMDTECSCGGDSGSCCGSRELADLEAKKNSKGSSTGQASEEPGEPGCGCGK